MTELETIQAASHPGTRASLAEDLRRMGLQAGMPVLVHSSLSRLGWVCGGPVAVVQALMDVVTPQGTLVMPAHSGDLSEPSYWKNPPVPAEWVDEIRATMPAFDPQITPTRGMGRIVDAFRTFPGVLRSYHPAVSFAAWGSKAGFITAGHTLENCMGEGSPLARLYDLDGWVLLLGISHGNNTSFHLGEVRSGVRKHVVQGAPVYRDGLRVWQTYDDIEYDDEHFPEIGAEFDRSGQVKVGRVGLGEARLFRQRPAVDFACQWLKEHSMEG